jgi:hypothetical protein
VTFLRVIRFASGETRAPTPGRDDKEKWGIEASKVMITTITIHTVPESFNQHGTIGDRESATKIEWRHRAERGGPVASERPIECRFPAFATSCLRFVAIRLFVYSF